MTGLIISFSITGLFLALMDINLFYRDGHWLYKTFRYLELGEWYLGVGGNKRWRKYGLVWDFWHSCKNLMLVSVGIGAAFAASTGLTWELAFIVPPTIGLAFTAFYHGVFGANW